VLGLCYCYVHHWPHAAYKFSTVCLSICLSVCMYVFLSDNNFRRPWRRKFIFAHPVQLKGIRVKFVYEGHRVKVKVQRYGPKSLFLQCKTSIRNNSVSLKHRAVKFACIIGFSVMADQMVWPTFLSHDRKWPRITKYTHSRVVFLRLQVNLVSCLNCCYSVYLLSARGDLKLA